MSQRVVCAANLIQDKTGKTYLITGARHWDVVMHNMFLQLKELGVEWEKKNVKQGFIDQHGVFLTREEAWIIAEREGQILHRCGGDGVKLFSENLY